MNRTLSLAMIACISTSAFAAGNPNTPPAAQTQSGEDSAARNRAAVEQADVQRAEQDRQIHAVAQQVMQDNGIAGMAIAITDHGTQRFYNFGVASKDSQQPVTSDTLFELGSISKTFTATLATWAQAQGRLKLDERIDTYLPALGDTRLGKIELLHLATHSAGGFPLQIPEQVQDERQLMDYYKAWQPQYLPGTHRSYANPSIGLLGMIAARSLNQPFVQAMQQGLFPALGLSSTFIEVPQDRQALYAQGYDKQNAPVRLNPGILANEAYGVKSSSADMIRFVEANMPREHNDAPLPKALLATHQGYLRFGPATQALIWETYVPPVTLDNLLAGNASDNALKTQPAKELNPPQPLKPGAWVNKTGSTNGFGGYVAFIADRQLGVVILANRNYPNVERVKLAWQILHTVDDQIGQ